MTITYSSPPAAPAALPELVDLSDVIDLLSSGSYLVTRPGAETTAHGVVTPGAPVYFYASGSLQPTSGKDIELLPEGVRTRESQTFYTAEVLLGPATPNGADRITIAGAVFEVQHIEDWQQLGGYHKVLTTKVST